MQQKNLKIAYYRRLFIGDNIIALDSMFCIKALYPQAHLCVYTGDIGAQIFAPFDFIDEVINIQNLSKQEIIKELDSKEFDYLILTQPNRFHTSLASKSNAKVIISFCMWHNIFRRFFGSVFGGILHSVFGVRLKEFRRVFYSRSFGDTPNYKRLLALVRAIDSKCYDSHINSIDFSPTRFPFSSSHREFVESALGFLARNRVEKSALGGGHLAQRVQQDWQRQNPQNQYGQHQNPQRKDAHFLNSDVRILLNPYSNSCSHSLTLNAYAKLANALAKSLPNAQIIISTPPYASPLPNLNATDNIHIFNNNHDLWNLIELVRLADLVISPSTSIIHIADNLAVPNIGLFNKTDLRLWLGKNMNKANMITLYTPTNKLTPTEENHIIEQVLQKVLAMLKNA